MSKTIGTYSTASDLLDFTIDGTMCYAAGKLPADVFVEFVGVLGRLGDLGGETEGGDTKVGMEDIGPTVELLSEAVTICCVPDTAAFIRKGMKDRQHPIDLELIQTILSDLMTEYGMAAKKDENGDDVDAGVQGDRPTQRTSESATGSSPTDGGSAEA